MTLLLQVCRAHEVPADDAWLSPSEAKTEKAFVFAKRRLDWRLGRWTAKQAIMRAGLAARPAEIAVIAADDGAPEAWVGPRRIDRSLSISHRSGVGLAALFTGCVGCDLELVEPRSPPFLEDFFTAAERRAVRDDHDAALYWTIKESTLKLMRTGLRRDTRSVEVRHVGRGSGWCPVEVADLEGGVDYRGWWCGLDRHVLTAISSPAVPRPADLRA